MNNETSNNATQVEVYFGYLCYLGSVLIESFSKLQNEIMRTEGGEKVYSLTSYQRVNMIIAKLERVIRNIEKTGDFFEPKI